MEASFPFIDSHCHFWDPGLLPCPWLAQVPSIAGRHTPAELRAEAGPLMPRRIVFVQAGSEPPEDEMLWVEELSSVDERRIAGIVAFVPVDRGARTTEALGALRGRPLVRGVRHLIQDEQDLGFCVRPEFIAGVRRLGEIGLSFDLCIRHHQLPPVIELVRACPGTSFVLDHLGKPPVRSGELDPWRENIARLAALPKVACKISGLVAEANPSAWTLAQLRPYVDHVVSVFGPERLMFGSDWPVVKIGSGYAAWARAACTLLESLAPAARETIFNQTARRVYRLGIEEAS